MCFKVAPSFLVPQADEPCRLELEKGSECEQAVQYPTKTRPLHAFVPFPSAAFSQGQRFLADTAVTGASSRQQVALGAGCSSAKGQRHQQQGGGEDRNRMEFVIMQAERRRGRRAATTSRMQQAESVADH